MLLTFILIIPALFAVGCGFAQPKQAKTIGLAGSVVTLILTLIAFFNYNGASGSQAFQMVEQHPWFPALNISYNLGVDGPGLLMILLTAFLTVAAVWFSMDRITEREKEYYALLLALEATVIGGFASLDLVLFYVFFEACLVPAVFLIGIWGGRNRIPAAMKFFVYTVVGSLLMLVSIIGLYIQTGTFDIIQIQQKLAEKPLPPGMAVLILLGFGVAFAVKTGLFPVHTWLPDTYAEAPTPVTAILSGAMAKLGTLGLYRFGIVLLPDAAKDLAGLFIVLGVVSIIYGGLIAAVQRDVRRVLAYSSISHLGFVVIGLFSGTNPGLSGATLQMVNHGITSGALFLIAGMILARRGTTHIRALGGLWEQMPLFGRFFLIATLSSVGLPLTNGFVGEFLILLGTFQNFPVLAGLATTGVIWSAIYMFQMFQKVMYGPATRPEVRRMPDVTRNEALLLAVFTALIFLLGIQPGVLQHKIDGSIEATLNHGGAPPVTVRTPIIAPPPGVPQDDARPTESPMPAASPATPTAEPNPATSANPTGETAPSPKISPSGAAAPIASPSAAGAASPAPASPGSAPSRPNPSAAP